MGNCKVTNLKTAHPLTNDAEFFPGVRKSWSLAFQINDEPAPTGRPAGGLMWAGLANSFYWIDPVDSICGAYLTQIFPFADTGSVPTFMPWRRRCMTRGSGGRGWLRGAPERSRANLGRNACRALSRATAIFAACSLHREAIPGLRARQRPSAAEVRLCGFEFVIARIVHEGLDRL